MCFLLDTLGDTTARQKFLGSQPAYIKVESLEDS